MWAPDEAPYASPAHSPATQYMDDTRHESTSPPRVSSPTINTRHKLAANTPVTQSSPASVLEVGSSVGTGSESCPTTEIHPRTRLQGGICKPKVYTDGTIRYNYLASVASDLVILLKLSLILIGKCYG
jgi:hypothetical protein